MSMPILLLSLTLGVAGPTDRPTPPKSAAPVRARMADQTAASVSRMREVRDTLALLDAAMLEQRTKESRMLATQLDVLWQTLPAKERIVIERRYPGTGRALRQAIDEGKEFGRELAVALDETGSSAADKVSADADDKMPGAEASAATSTDKPGAAAAGKEAKHNIAIEVKDKATNSNPQSDDAASPSKSPATSTALRPQRSYRDDYDLLGDRDRLRKELADRPKIEEPVRSVKK